jgi:hypothetical protein
MDTIAGEVIDDREGCGLKCAITRLRRHLREMNSHDAALVVHGDQGVRGTPLKQIMRGFAPCLFRHQTPDGNRIAPCW